MPVKWGRPARLGVVPGEQIDRIGAPPGHVSGNLHGFGSLLEDDAPKTGPDDLRPAVDSRRLFSCGDTALKTSPAAWVISVTRLLAEQDLEHVAVLDLVGLALRAQPAVLARLGHRAELEEVLVGDRLGPDEAPRQVGVDRPGGIDRG